MLELVETQAASDGELAERVRSGDTAAFAELWQRHYRPAYRAASQFSRMIDPDDLLSEAYLRVYQLLLRGLGPRGAFRPYLYATIRNIATNWATSKAATTSDPLEDDPEDVRIVDDPAVAALNRSLTSRAFRALPERWQTVLWYTEIEGMDPHEVAPILGLSPNGVAALSMRAREGLRAAWLQAHVKDEGQSEECRWALSKMGGNARQSLGKRDQARLDAHIPDCPRCILVSEEVEEVGSRLAMVMIPIALGGVAGGGLIEAMNEPGSLDFVHDLAMPALPDGLDGGSPATALTLPLVSTVLFARGRRAKLVAIVGAVLLVIGAAIAVERSIDSARPELPAFEQPANFFGEPAS